MSTLKKKVLGRLAFISATVLASASAFAANPMDPQEQARMLLMGNTNHAESARSVALHSVGTSSADPQEQARSMIVGDGHRTSTAVSPVSAVSNNSALDAQQQASSMLLGNATKPVARVRGGSLAARSN
jgi:hypothetical protein